MIGKSLFCVIGLLTILVGGQYAVAGTTPDSAFQQGPLDPRADGSAGVGSANVSVPFQQIPQGGQLTVPITVDPADGVIAIDLELDYDPGVIQPIDVLLTGFTSGMSLTSNLDLAGTALISLFGTTPLAGSGVVAQVVFEAVGAVGTGSDLVWQHVSLNEDGIASTAVDGRVNVVGGTSEVSVPECIAAEQNSTVVVPIAATPADGFLGLDLTLSFDASVLMFSDAQVASPLAEDFSIVAFPVSDGVLNLGLFGAVALAGSGPIIEVEFMVIGTTGEQSVLDLSGLSVNEGSIAATVVDGMFAVGPDSDGDGLAQECGDCDDTDAAVYAGAPELCDLVDNQCDGDPGFGTIDEGFDLGQPCTFGGVDCPATGFTICNPDGTDTVCDAEPASDDVTCDGMDDDCNGFVDDGFVPQPTVCGVGACESTGSTSCLVGVEMDSCVPGTPDVSDLTCNGIDEDCNGAPDDGYIPQPTVCGTGACQSQGLLDCFGGIVLDTCTAGVPAPSDATCDGVDDDCNGVADDAFVPQPTVCGEGACESDGLTSCIGGIFMDNCAPGVPSPSDATCDLVDDDCDGTVDEDGDCGPPPPAPRFEVLSVSVAGTATTVPLGQEYASPVVVCSVQYDNNTTPVVTRVSQVTSSSFDVRLQNPSGGPVSADPVDCIVVEKGSWEVGGILFEAQTYLSTVTDENNRWTGEVQTYSQAYENPVVLGQVMTEHDPDWSVFWSSGSSRARPPSAADLKTGKTVAEDTDVSRVDETIGFVGFETAHGTLGGVEFEARLGADTVRGTDNSPPFSYTFSAAFASAPEIAVVTQAAMDNSNGAWAQNHGPTQATPTTLFVSVDEDQIRDTERSHSTEQVGYVAFATGFVYQPPPECTVADDCDDGLYCNGSEICNQGICQPGDNPCVGEGCNEESDTCDPSIPIGRFEVLSTLAGQSAVSVPLTDTYVSPVVVCSVQYIDNTLPVVTRVSNVTADSFDVRLQNPSGAAVAQDPVHCTVVEQGVWTIDGVKLEAQTYVSTVTDENNDWTGEVQTYGQSYTNPVVLGQVMSEIDPGWSVFWCRGSARTRPPSATALVTGKTVGEDTDVTRANETIGFIVFEAGHGTIAGVEFEAHLGRDSVRSAGNAPPYVYTFDTPFASPPEVVVVSQAAMDDSNGSWAQTFGATPTTSTTCGLSLDEDQIRDVERRHSTEQVGYVAFQSAVAYE